jgi:hypothetical protein
VLDGAGKIGMGTDYPQARLHVVGGAIMPSVGNAVDAGIQFPNDAAGGGGDNAWIRYYARTGEAMTLDIGIGNDADDHIALRPSGNVGIGTNNPTKGKLEVNGSAGFATSGPLFGSGYTGANWSGTANVSIWATSTIVANNFLSASDKRLKKDISKSANAQDLELVSGMEVVEFKYTDFINNTDVKQKGFIAQQIESLFPEAVKKHADFVPDVFELADKTSLKDGVLTVTTLGKHNFVTGDVVRLITELEGTKELPVVVTDEKTFTVSGWELTSSSVFVYGKKVEDSRTIDYQQIFCVGISAIQQLNKQLQQLKEEITGLKLKLFPTLVA